MFSGARVGRSETWPGLPPVGPAGLILWESVTGRPSGGKTEDSNAVGTTGPTDSAAGPQRTDQQTWAAGDFSRVATGQTIVGELLCEAVELHARERVLDVATGSGNTAIAAARRRAVVTGVDFVPSLLERARDRSTVERLRIDFRNGRAEELPFVDGSFDCILSTFGAMFAPDQARAASELVRVCRAGGRIGLASWTPGGFTGRLFHTTARHVPALSGIEAATRWGTEPGLRQLFRRESRIDARLCHVVMRADSPEAYVAFFRKFFGPTITAFESLDPSGQAALERDLLDEVRASNLATDGTTFIPSEYLEVVVRPQ